MYENPERQDALQASEKCVIRIPSYEEVFSSSQPEAASSLSRSSSSFSETFSFVKSTEFYTPPPPASDPASASSASALRQTEAITASSFPSNSVSASHLPQSPYQHVQSRNAILVSHRQKGNPLLKHIRNVKWTFADIVCDYLLGQSSCALYLSLRYHLLHPDYLYYRIKELQKNIKLRVVLCHVDVEDVIKPLLEVTRTALLHDCTLLCGWSLEECGRYLETIKVYENKSPDSIRGRMDTDYMSRLNHALTAVRHINKNDVVTLGSTFGSLSRIMDASMEELARCPGIGDRKVRRLYDTFHEPFKCVVAAQLTPMPDNSSQMKADVKVEGGEEQEEELCDAKQAKRPCVSVKSALAAAYTRYSEKAHKRDQTTAISNKEIPDTPSDRKEEID